MKFLKILCIPFEILRYMFTIIGFCVSIIILFLCLNIESDYISEKLSISNKQIIKEQIKILDGGIEAFNFIKHIKEKRLNKTEVNINNANIEENKIQQPIENNKVEENKNSLIENNKTENKLNKNEEKIKEESNFNQKEIKFIDNQEQGQEQEQPEIIPQRSGFNLL